MAFLYFTCRLGLVCTLMFSILLPSYRADDKFPVDKGLPNRLSSHIGPNAHTGDTRHEIPSQLSFQVGEEVAILGFSLFVLDLEPDPLVAAQC